MTVIIIATPTYGATLHKMYLRIAGFVIGGAVSLLAIIIVSPNFETLPAYMLAAFAVFYLFAYCSLGNSRISYAGKQMGIIFSLVFVGLSPSVNIYEPLWRIWGVLLGDFVVAVVFFTLWPEYAGDSLLPRLRRVLANMLALAPSGSASSSEDQILKTNSDTIRVLTEFSRSPMTHGWKDAPAPSTIMGSLKRRGLFAGLRTGCPRSRPRAFLLRCRNSTL